MTPNTKQIGQNLIWLDRVDSTNTYLKNRCHELPHGTAAFTDCQTAGKGRRGNQWNGSDAKVQPGSNLALSFLLKDVTVEDMGILPLICALAVRRAVLALTGAPAGIKWPNDMILKGKKLCGILCESRIAAHDGQGEAFCAICGIGVNLTQNQQDFDALNLPHAISLLLACGRVFKPEKVTAAILEAFEQAYLRYREEGFPALLQEYREGCVTLGRQVRVIWDQQIKEGVALDISPKGELVCSIEGAVHTVRSGEASVRGLYGYI